MMEEIIKNIDAIEEEKKEYLDEYPEREEISEGKDEGNEEVEQDVEITEIVLSDIEIEEWITKLQLLKESKEPISLEIDDENELLINYEEEDVEVEE